jgi:primary-amine oxidase
MYIRPKVNFHRPRRLLSLVLFCFLLPGILHAAATHPLDALEASEITSAVAILRQAGQADDHTLFSAITLREPAKSFVLNWQEGEAIPRVALVVMRQNARTREAIVNLVSGKVTSYKEIPGAQPLVTLPEILTAIGITTADPRMRAALEKRGITDFDQLFCAPRTVGNFGRDIEQTRRLVKVDCFDIRGVRTDVFANPIEGLFATVDLDHGEVLEVTDLGVVPVPGGNSELDPASTGLRSGVNPVVQSLPQGGNVRMHGSMVHWQNWSFHLRWDIRAGIIISLVSYRDHDTDRSVLYQGSLAEIFVPYQDPTEGWYFRNYMDEGDYGFGTMAFPLQAGADCPATALFLSPVMSNAAGGADTLENRICIFERSPGEPVWRHYDFITEELESRPAIELIVRYIATVGNYDYVLDWIFDQKAGITYRGGASGIDSVKGVKSQTLADETASEDTAWGPLIAPGRAGINHDHFLSLRLDLDVDGTANTFVRDTLVVEELAQESPRRSVWRTQQVPAKSESEAKFRLSYEHPAMWRVLNPHKNNAVGYPVSYAFSTAGNALPLVGTDDPPLGRAMFANYHLWVTPYAPAERYAAGDYPNQSTPGQQGLAAWTAANRAIENTDIVLWYTLGFHHVPSAEDWPVYNLGWHSVTLRPYNFFDRNPAIDVPPVESPIGTSAD